MKPAPEVGGINRFATMSSPSSLAPGTLERYATMPMEKREPSREEIARAVLRFAPDGNRMAGVKLMMDQQQPEAAADHFADVGGFSL
mgnify:CR=1 FL=1